VGTIRSHLVGAWFQMRGVIGHYLETTLAVPTSMAFALS
jgi:hypothetical protein